MNSLKISTRSFRVDVTSSKVTELQRGCTLFPHERHPRSGHLSELMHFGLRQIFVIDLLDESHCRLGLTTLIELNLASISESRL